MQKTESKGSRPPLVQSALDLFLQFPISELCHTLSVFVNCLYVLIFTACCTREMTVIYLFLLHAVHER